MFESQLASMRQDCIIVCSMSVLRAESRTTHQHVSVVEYLGRLYQGDLAQPWPFFLVQVQHVGQHNLQSILPADEICRMINALPVSMWYTEDDCQSAWVPCLSSVMITSKLCIDDATLMMQQASFTMRHWTSQGAEDLAVVLARA